MSEITLSLILQLVILGSFYFFLLQLLRQQGRILLRLEVLEGKPGSPGKAAPTGLAVGTRIEDFRLVDVNGRHVSLSDLRGRRVLLAYWSSECGYCDLAAAGLAELQPRLQKNNTELVLVSYGNSESNRKLADEHGLKNTILLLGESQAQKYFADDVFRSCGTPSAYLLDEEARVVEPLAVGVDAVIHLARGAVSDTIPKEMELKHAGFRKLPVSESRIEREGLKPGTPAPNFTLPEVRGGIVSLDQFRGRKVLLVFTDPHCGPCEAVMPDLVRLHDKHGNNGLAVVMIGRGNAEENRQKAIQHGIAFPVLLQERWKLSRQYGIFAAPVAFLISQDGVIMRDVAKGPDQIMTLARDGLTLN